MVCTVPAVWSWVSPPPYKLIMGRILVVSLCLCVAPFCGLAQNATFHHNNVVVGVGPAIPTGSSTTFLGTAPLIKVAYGYRFSRFFQADAGFQMAFGAANNQNPVVTDFGTVRGGDHEFMIPLGGRVIIPTPFHRFEVSAGGGAAYLHYSETAPSGGGEFSINCFNCTSRGGWGGYGLANVSYFLDDSQIFHVGTTFQYIAGHTNGQAVANFPALRTSDHWANLTLEFGISF